jgi:putative transposase
MQKISFERHRFSFEIIVHAVWIYARFTLSFRDVEGLLDERGLDVFYGTVRRGFSSLVARFQRIWEQLDLHPAIIGISMKW